MSDRALLPPSPAPSTHAPAPHGDPEAPPPGRSTLRRRLHTIVFEADTPAGRAFDVTLIAVIVVSIAVIMLESVAQIAARHGATLRALEWGITIIFTAEYLLRLSVVERPLRWARSFFGLVDLLALLSGWLSIVITGGQVLTAVRVLRLLRAFRVLKLGEYLGEARELGRAMRASRRRILVFVYTVLTIVVIVGAVMYVVEGPRNGFTSIPRSMYWAIVTLTTVGFGDVTPQTDLGQLLASLVMILGYGIIAVPTGIVTAELTAGRAAAISTQACPSCGAEGHDADARHCKWCGVAL
jgi:voltage-gated potassium channel